MKTGIALGSNLGDRRAHLAAARDFVFSQHAGETRPACSGLYETEPVGCAPGTAPFLNAVVEIETSLDPRELLRRLREFEMQSGRTRSPEKNSPREIDLDLLYCGDLRLDTPALVIPHSRMTTRRFVMQPLADIRPELVLPGQTETARNLLAHLPAAPAARLIARDW